MNQEKLLALILAVTAIVSVSSAVITVCVVTYRCLCVSG